MMKILTSLVILSSIILTTSGCISQSLDCAKPENFCVGLVTEVGWRDDRAYNQAAWEGIQQAKSDGIADWTASIETIDARDYEENIRVFAEAGYDVIVTVGYGSSAATYAAAGQYSNIYFIGADQRPSADQINLVNLAWLVFPEDQLGFLAGALAAEMTQSGRVGAVCGSDAWPPMKSFGDGFIAGVLYIKPEVIADVTYHNEVGLGETFTDPTWGATAADTLVDNGADIIFGVGGTTGSNAIVAAVMRDAYGIGSDIDEFYTLPVAAPHLYTSVVKLIAPAVTGLIFSAGKAENHTSVFPAGNYIGRIDLAPYHDLDSSIPDEVKLRMSDLVIALQSGEIHTGVAH